VFSNIKDTRSGLVTFGQALGTRDLTEPLELNSAASATCTVCGIKPRLNEHTTPKGRLIRVWIPAACKCKGGKL